MRKPTACLILGVCLIFLLTSVGAAAPSGDKKLGTRVLKLGVSGSDVSELQSLLKSTGFDPGPVDGYFGPRTAKAVKAFQKARGLKASGVVEPTTVAALKEAAKAAAKAAAKPPTPGSYLVRKGDTLSGIAARFGLTLKELVTANKLKDPNLVMVGQTLVIPEPGRSSSSSQKAQGSQKADNSSKKSRTLRTNIPVQVYSPVVVSDEATIAGRGSTSTVIAQPGDKRVALTFDDGPDPELTPKILEILGRYGARATFFVKGEAAARHPHILKLMVEGGHAIGNHGYSHRDLTGLSRREVEEEIDKTSAAITDATGVTPAFFRPPLGAYTGTVMDVVERKGFDLIMWTNIGSQDLPGIDPKTVAARVIRSTYDGAIILLHDTRSNVVEALPLILSSLREKGYSMVTLSDLLDQK